MGTDDDATYREQLVATAEKAQELFDRTLLTLSGGALGVSFAFVKQFVGAAPMHTRGWLVGAWVAWLASLVASLLSHYVSSWAQRQAIDDLDAGKEGALAPRLDRGVGALNFVALVSFLAGLGSMAAFVSHNLE